MPTAPVLPPPLLLGDHPALEWLNSRFAADDLPVDLIGDGAGLRQWLRATAVLPPVLVAGAAQLPRAELDRLAREAVALREWVRELMARWSLRGPTALRPADLDRLNALMAAAPHRQRLGREGGVLHIDQEPAATNAAAVLGALAALVADLLTRHRPDDVRRCENPDCTLWFADTKRGPRRRWCSMALCGNRHKVAAHRARQRSPAQG